jgi:hypothetical protein
VRCSAPLGSAAPPELAAPPAPAPPVPPLVPAPPVVPLLSMAGLLPVMPFADCVLAGSSSSWERLPEIECGMPYGGVQERSWVSAGPRATMITPTTSAAMPPAWIASMPGVTWIRSPNTMTPSRMPTSGSPAEMAGSDSCNGPALNALCISQMPMAPAPTSAYGAQVVNMPLIPLDCRISSVCLVSASWMPNTRPAPIPVSIARLRPGLRSPACTQTNAIPAIAAAAGQCDTEPNDRPIGFADLDADSKPTPVMRTAAPRISQTLSDALARGTAITSANTRFMVSNGSTNVSDKCPIDQAASTSPPIMDPIPASQRGFRSRSVISRRLRKRESGSRCAAFCWRTKPVPISSAARRVRP